MIVASCARTSSGFFSDRSAQREAHCTSAFSVNLGYPDSAREDHVLTADKVHWDLALPRSVQYFLHARLLAQLLHTNLVPRRSEREERVDVREL